VGKRVELAAILKDGHFDVIHFHNISLLGGPGVLRYGQGVKLCTVHDHWFVCPMHVLWRFNREPCARRTCLACTLHGRRPPQLWRYSGGLRRQLVQVDAFIAPSRFARDSHQRNGFPAEMQVISHFLPEAELALAAPAIADDLHDRPYFLFVGRLEKIKGLQEVIAAFASYDKADLLIAGAGGYEATLRAQAAGLPHVHFLGYQEQEQLRRLYGQAIAVIVPSLCYETFGWPVLEAFSTHTPVIVHDLGALPEVAATGGVSYRSPAGLLEAMERLRAQKGLRNKLGEEGFRLYQQHYTEVRHLEQYFGLITRLEADRRTAQGQRSPG
jgi:glycosyltransferase involved in cell wall biosynthesis